MTTLRKVYAWVEDNYEKLLKEGGLRKTFSFNKSLIKEKIKIKKSTGNVISTA